VSILERVRQLTPIQFRYREQLDPSGALRGGFSAQQVQQIFPDAVVEENGVLMINLEVLSRYVQLARLERSTQQLLESSQ
jgi:hypothetical protein